MRVEGRKLKEEGQALATCLGYHTPCLLTSCCHPSTRCWHPALATNLHCRLSFPR